MHASLTRPRLDIAALFRPLQVLLALLLAASTVLSAQPPRPPSPPPLPVLDRNFGQLPLAFLPGLMESADTQFHVRGLGGDIAFTPGEVVLALPGAAQSPQPGQPLARPASPAAVLRLQFDGANPAPQIDGVERLPGSANYFLGDDPALWRQNVPTYGGLVYSGLYPGVDLRFDGAAGSLKGTYTVAAGADPNQIRWRYVGADRLRLESSGDLLITPAQPAAAELIESAPVAWQIIDGRSVDVPARFVLDADGTVAFALGEYDRRYALTIDPTLTYGSYLGGNQGANGQAIAVDPSGYIYVAGYTRSTDFVTANPRQATNGGGSYDAFVTKLAPNGRTIIYSTYLGGSQSDYGLGVAADSDGRTYLTGWTTSSNFPTANALRPAKPGVASGFVAKLNASGGALIYSTYLSASNAASDDTRGEAIAIDASGNAFVAGSATVGGSGGRDAFVARLSPAGDGLGYFRYLGGSDDDEAVAVATDGSGNLAIVGTTASENFPALNARQGYAGAADAFVAKLNAGDGSVVFSTFLGGDDIEGGAGVAFDRAGAVYATGTTYSPNFPTQNPRQGFGGQADAFVTKISPDGALAYSTYLGGSEGDSGEGIAVDESGNAHVIGSTTSANFPIVGGVQNGRGSSFDAFVSKLNPAGNMLVYSTFLGGNDFDFGYAVAVDAAGNAYVTGETGSTNFPTVNPLQSAKRSTNSDLGDAFVARINDGSGTGQQPVPPNDTTTVPGRPASAKIVGALTVYAASFADNANGWTATGTVWIGDYTLIENATITLNGGSLTGSGLVSMITGNNQRTRIFRGSFGVNTGSGALVPSAIDEWLIRNLAGFRVGLAPSPAQVTINTLGGRLDTTLGLGIAIPGPGNRVLASLPVSLDQSGAITGLLSNVVFKLGPLDFRVIGATLGSNGFTITQARLALPLGLGGNSAEFDAANVRITSAGRLDLGGGGKIRIKFPNISVGGARGFGIEGATAELQVNGDEYVFRGEGTFGLPGVGKGSNGRGSSCGIGTRFTVSNMPPPVREVAVSIEGCFSIPIANTGFFLTAVRGSVVLDEGNVSVDLGISITGGPKFAGTALVQGDADAHWDTSWAIGISGSIKVLSFEVARAALRLSQARGLEGSITIKLALGFVQGTAEFRAWQNNGFHVTGSAIVNVGVAKGTYLNECVDVGLFDGCISIPPTDLQVANARADFGEFVRDGRAAVYGMKGSVRISIAGSSYGMAFFVGTDGALTFRGADRYTLLQPPGVLASVNSDARQFTVAPSTPLLLGGMLNSGGTPTLRLVAPDKQVYDAGSPGVVVTNTPTQTLLSVVDPLPGTWQLEVNNLGGEQYHLFAYGARPAATIAAPTVASNSDGSYTIGLVGSSATPTSTLSLFYDTNPISYTGQPIVQGLPLGTSSYTWRPDGLAEGTYHVYAMIDDPLGAPALAYSPTPVTVIDNTPPPTPSGLRVQGRGTSALVSWDASQAPDIAGYRVYYTEPGSGVTTVADIPAGGDTSYTQEGLYLNGAWEFSISAYDLSENESARGAPVGHQVQQGIVYLPLTQR